MIRRALSVILREGLPATTFPQVVDSLRHHGVKRVFCKSSSAQSSSLASVISEEFRRDADKASADIAALPETLRMKVLHALTQDMESPGNVKYIKASQAQPVATEAHTKDQPLTREQLTRVFSASAIPFVGFGFLDNLIMIVAGDYIDASLGTAFCLSTMAAAGFGNLISDIAGIFCADSIESRARVFKYGRMPRFSPAQAHSAPVSYAKSLGAVLGISIGCLLGMFPLLFSTHQHAGPCSDPDAAAAGDGDGDGDAGPVVIADA